MRCGHGAGSAGSPLSAGARPMVVTRRTARQPAPSQRKKWHLVRCRQDTTATGLQGRGRSHQRRWGARPRWEVLPQWQRHSRRAGNGRDRAASGRHSGGRAGSREASPGAGNGSAAQVQAADGLPCSRPLSSSGTAALTDRADAAGTWPGRPTASCCSPPSGRFGCSPLRPVALRAVAAHPRRARADHVGELVILLGQGRRATGGIPV
jgi:hypothetical protein